MKISFHQISLVVMAVATSFGYSVSVSAQQLRAGNIDEVVKALTLEEKCHLVLGRGMHFNDDAKFPGTAGSTFSVNRLGIPETYCADSQQGLRMNATRAWDHNDYYPTDFVASMTLASTWDREAAFKVGQGIGNEVREFGLDWILSPAMNLIRNPLCGRNHEYYSEDPYLSGTIAAGYVKGVQSEGTAACPKHFVANNQETNRNNNISQVSQRALREIYLKAFEIMVKESNPWTIMTSYNKLNGPYALQNRELLTTIVRDEWGWKGMFVSDWNAGDDAVAAMLAGNDMLQPGQDKQYKAILEAAKSGEAADRSEADFYLKEGEAKLIKAVSEAYHAKGKQVVVLLDICSPIDVASWQNQIDALVCTWQGGQESGFSVADVLSGKVNPSGKLPMTFQVKYGDAYADKNFPSNVDDKTLGAMFMWGYNKDQAPKERKPQANIDYTNYEEDIYVGYRYFDSFGKAVAYPFGFGLSYTTFSYTNMSVSEANGVYTVKVDVKNTGTKAGRNVVELFVAAPNSKKLNKPDKELRNYAKTSLLQPGQTETVTMQVKVEDLASFNEKASAWKTDAGRYTFLICSSANDIEAKASANVKAWSKKVNNVMKPNVKLNLLKR